jgi:hypothetical protein
VPRRKDSTDLLDHLCRINRQLGRLGVEPLTKVEDAAREPSYRIREIIHSSEEYLSHARKALGGYLG